MQRMSYSFNYCMAEYILVLVKTRYCPFRSGHERARCQADALSMVSPWDLLNLIKFALYMQLMGDA